MAVKELIPWKRDDSTMPVRRDTDVFNHFSHFLDSFFGDSRLSSPWNDTPNWAYNPRVDIQETANAYELSAELPGLSEKDVDISLENGILKISGQKHEEKEEKNEGGNYYRRERSYGRFERSFRLPDHVEADKVEARYKNGVLHVSVPKIEAAKNPVRKIEIKSE